MKKVISVLLVLTLAAGLMLPAAVSAEWAQGENVDLRVGILNDTHITQKLNTIDIVADAIEAQMTIGGGKLDGLALVGDVVYYPNKDDDPTNRDHYDALYEVLEEKAPGVPIAYAIGNHEFPQSNHETAVSDAGTETFIAATGQQLNYHTTFGDYHFIAGGGYGYGGTFSEEKLEWLMTEIDAAIAADSTNAANGTFPEGVIPDSPKPVFLLLHHPIEGSVFGATGSRYSSEFLAFLKTRPQVINITAHWHVPANLPQVIWQDGFTVFQSPLTSGGYLEEYEATSTGNYSDYHQGSMIEITDNVVKLQKLNYNEQAYIGTPWIIDVPAIVADKTDNNPNNDLDHYLYSADKRTVSNAPVFPEDAAVSVQASATAANITYPNTAVMTATGDGTQQDGFTRGYKVTVETANGAVVASKTYMTDFYKAESARSATFTRLITGLTPGITYTAKVYPQSPLGTFGEPISATFATLPQEVPDSAVRYEFEDYYPNQTLVHKTDMASGGAIVSSHQGGMLSRTEEPRNTENPVIELTFDIEVPIDDTYKVEYAASFHTNSTYVSHMDFYIDAAHVGDNGEAHDYDLSMGGQFPWQYTPLYHYTGSSVYLTAGTHTVTVEINLPTAEKEQPFLFCLDYLQLTPQTAMLTPTTTSRIEFETYAEDVPAIPNANGTSFQPKNVSCEGSSGGKYLQIDSEAVEEGTVLTFSIPFYVQKAEKYIMEYVGIQCSPVAVYVDSTDSTNIAEGIAPVGIDEKNEAGVYPVFGSKWFQAKSYPCPVTLTEGKHELIFVVSARSDGDIAQYLDYIEFTSGVEYILQEAATIEMEKYASAFSYSVPVIKESFNTSGGKYIQVDTDHTADHPDMVADIPIHVEKAGVYAIEYVASNVGSAVELSVNGEVLNTQATAVALDEKDEAANAYPYFGERYHGAKKYSFRAALPAGASTLEVRLKARPEQGGYDVAICMDYIRIRSTEEIVAAEGTSTIELEDHWQNCEPINSGFQIGQNASASAGAYGYTGAGGSEPVVLEVPFTVQTDGVYNIEYVAAGASHLSTSYLYIDSTEEAPLFTVAYNTGENISQNKTLFSQDYPARKYTGKLALVAGEHTLIIRADPRNSGSLTDVAFALDYISFTASHDGLTVKDGVAQASVVYDAPVTGKAVLAVYDNGRLVSVGTKDVEQATVLTIAANAESATDAKIMIINSLAALTPQAAAKALQAE